MYFGNQSISKHYFLPFIERKMLAVVQNFKEWMKAIERWMVFFFTQLLIERWIEKAGTQTFDVNILKKILFICLANATEFCWICISTFFNANLQWNTFEFEFAFDSKFLNSRSSCQSVDKRIITRPIEYND